MKQSQTQRLYALLRDGRPHRTNEILERVYGNGHAGIARIGARIADVKARYGVKILGWHDHDNHALYWYQMAVKREAVVLPPAFDRKEEKVEAVNNQTLF